MAQITSLLPDVIEVARNCPEPTAVAAYRRAARQLCQESKWLRRELAAFETEQGTSAYELVQDTGDPLLEVIGVRVVTCNSITGPTSSWPVNKLDGTQWVRRINQGPPGVYQYVPESAIAVYPVPDKAYELVVTVQCQPKADAEELPDDLLGKWVEVLNAGALWRLMRIKGQPWSDPQEARKYEAEFKAGINNAKADEQRAYSNGTTMARKRRIM